MSSVLCGDCFEELKRIESKSVDLILTDPPYNISRKSNFKKNSNNKKYNNISLEFGDWDLQEINLELLIPEFYRILRRGGTLIIFYDIWKSNSLKEICEKSGFKQPRVCQWIKKNPVPINSHRNYLSNGVEYFFSFVKGGKCTFNSKYDNGVYNYPICHGKERTSHPTQKPINLINDIVLKHSNINDLVLDPFGGSGTTALSCMENDRRYILIEKDEKFVEMSIERIKRNLNKQNKY